MLVGEAIEDAIDRFSSAGVISPSVDAEILCAFSLGIDRSELTQWVVLNREFPKEKVDRFLELVSRREKREPLQHITQVAAFRHIELEVGPGVFIPRPETEQVVSLAIATLAKVSNPVVVDLCSGSGAIGISLSTELSGAKVFGVELSAAAFGFLKRNWQKYGLDPNLLRNQDLAGALDELQGQVDLVISNPPYIPTAAVPVDLEVQLHDPPLALYGGDDGLDVIRSISTRALFLLRPAGHLVLEHADTQAAAIRELLLTSGWQDVHCLQDLAGKDRMTYAKKP